jgi:ribokinase
MPVTVVGSANIDLVVTCDHLPRPGETLLGRGFNTFPGGKGANQAVVIGRLRGNVSLIAAVGQDPFGNQLLDSLDAAGVETAHIQRSAEPTGVALITVQTDGQNTIVVAPGANATLAPEHLPEIQGVLLTQLEIPLETVKAALANETPTLKILNPAPGRDDLDGLLPLVDILTPNESECEALTGIRPSGDDTCRQAAQILMDKGVKTVVITLGAEGAYLYDYRGGRRFPTIKVDAIDATAAGDAFSGALAHFLDTGHSIEEAVTLANRVAALSTTKAGAQPSMPTMADLQGIG